MLRSARGAGPHLQFLRTPGTKTVKNRLDLDLRPYPGDEAAETARLRALGATGIDPGQGDVPQTWLADPEGPRARRPDPALKQSVDLPCTTIMDVA